jgi:alkylated DNA repair dioxygenase AlkB
VYLGFEVRVELVRSDGVVMSVQLARGEAERLRLESGQVVHARPSRQKLFEQAAESKPALVA